MTRGRAKGTPRCGGRQKGDPNITHSFTITKNHRYPKTASERRKNSGGKVHICIDVPPLLYDQILNEAKGRRTSFASLALEYLTAGACPE